MFKIRLPLKAKAAAPVNFYEALSTDSAVSLSICLGRYRFKVVSGRVSPSLLMNNYVSLKFIIRVSGENPVDTASGF